MLDDLLNVGLRKHPAVQQPVEDMVGLQPGFNRFIQTGHGIRFFHIAAPDEIVFDLLRGHTQAVFKEVAEYPLLRFRRYPAVIDFEVIQLI